MWSTTSETSILSVSRAAAARISSRASLVGVTSKPASSLVDPTIVPVRRLGRTTPPFTIATKTDGSFAVFRRSQVEQLSFLRSYRHRGA